MTRSRPSDAIGILLLVAAALVAAFIFSRGGERSLERSAIGQRGLVTWLRSEGVEIRYPTGRVIDATTLGLSILPILDTDLEDPFIRPEDDADFLATGTERDLYTDIVTSKTDQVPTLVIAPKWTRAMRHSGYAHESLLLPQYEAQSGVNLFEGWEGDYLRPGGLFEFRVGEQDGLLYEPQLFSDSFGPECEPYLSAGRGHLVLHCKRENTEDVWLLSDPDLMNNHGLALADNALIARDLLTGIAGGKAILVDTSQSLFIVRNPTEAAQRREWSDLLRVFAWPYLLAWIGAALLTVLVLWRAWVRFGIARQVFSDQMGAARQVSIAAKARVLRMSGNDPQLFATHVENRVRTIERHIFGRNMGDHPIQRIAGFVGRRDPALARGFSTAASAAMTPPAGSPATSLMSLLDAFERQAERVLNESR